MYSIYIQSIKSISISHRFEILFHQVDTAHGPAPAGVIHIPLNKRQTFNVFNLNIVANRVLFVLGIIYNP